MERCRSNVKFLIEGEEEVGGASRRQVSSRRTRRSCSADVALVSDTAMYAEGMPTLVHRTARPGLHGSRRHRPGARPAFRPCTACAGAAYRLRSRSNCWPGWRTPNGDPADPGRLSTMSRSLAAAGLASWQAPAVRWSDEFRRQAKSGPPHLSRGEPDPRQCWSCVWSRPGRLEVHGIAGGFTAAGAKTVDSGKATAKRSASASYPRQDAGRR